MTVYDPEGKHLTFQHFTTSDQSKMVEAQKVTSHTQLSDVADWRPDLVFDTAYGIAALKTSTRAIYCEGNGGDQNGRGDDTNQGNRSSRQFGGEQHQKVPGLSRHAFGVWMLNAGDDQREAHAVKSEKTKAKVQTWLDSAERFQDASTLA